MNMPSFYQGDLYRELVASGRVNLQVFFARKISADRQQLGWQDSTEGFSHHFVTGLGEAARLAWQNRRQTHIVNGLWAEPTFLVALLVLALCRSRYLIYSEAPDPRYPRPKIRYGLQRLVGRWLTGRAAAVLPISHFATDFYGQLGATRFYPFGYFRARPELSPTEPASQTIEMLYIGQLIQRKGIDLLFAAMAQLVGRYPNLHLTLIGGGEQAQELPQWIDRYGLTGRVQIVGPLPAGQIPARLQQASLFVLPSRWDGWGMVVNEALSVGVPVIVSNACGVADLIRNGLNGFVFESENGADLQRCLEQFLEQPAQWPRWRANAQKMGHSLSTAVVAPYLLDCLDHLNGLRPEQPIPPWQATLNESSLPG